MREARKPVDVCVVDKGMSPIFKSRRGSCVCSGGLCLFINGDASELLARLACALTSRYHVDYMSKR